MAASAIAISSDSLDESMGSPPSRAILFGDIPTVIPSISMVAPKTSTTTLVISSAAPMIEMTIIASPTGLCGLVPYSDSNYDSPNEMDSPGTLMLLPLLIGGAGVMIVRKRVGPRPALRLAWRRVSPRSSDHRPSSSSSPADSSPVHSSGLDAPESSSRDSSERPLHSSSHTAGPSHKRCRSPADSVPSSTPVIGSLAPTRADLLPPRKRFRDSYSSETCMEADTEIDTTKTEDGRELDIVNGDN
nr:hypothetical protein [Tanacetum cinerariifolium]